ncbi:MAG: alkylphosphonate utilization protein [Atopostipes suicloacalis]|nr:alkylphosphonate utilization protein [Atopostipes suicloacalis]MDN6730554.1 alkylphosphonate utilization protein [Atopostipes suicloacalis]
MSELANCPECGSEYTYEDRNLIVCSMCGYEWSEEVEKEAELKSEKGTAEVIRDVHGNILEDGDELTVIKDLKVKGSSNTLKRGTTVKNIQLIYDAADGHDINCKIKGFGQMKLKSEFVKKL